MTGEIDTELIIRFPVACAETLSILKVAQLPPASVLAKSQLNELDEIEKTFILALDDYHFIRDKSVHGLIAKLLHYPSSFMHFVLAPHLTISIVVLCNT